MDYDHNNVRRAVEEDRLSSLPDELIHQILSCLDMKFAVQTCLLSSRWKPLWKSVTRLNFSSRQFVFLPKFVKFVTHVLSRRSHQSDVSTIKLNLHRAAGLTFLKKIANYAFSHNVQELTLVSSSSSSRHVYPPCLFSSQSLKHFTLTYNSMTPSIAFKTPLDFPALITLHLSKITLCDNLFTNCVNLENLTLEHFRFTTDSEVFEIITPRLSNLMLLEGQCWNDINVKAPQLENLTIINCSIVYMNAPPGISSLCYTGYFPQKFSTDRFHSLNKVSICLSMYGTHKPYDGEVARRTIDMLQEVRSARSLTLNADIVECLSAFPDLLSHHPSPFSNLNCLTIDYSKSNDAHRVTMSSEIRKFLLENSPSATLIMNNPKVHRRR